MSKRKKNKGTHKGGEIFIFEPSDMALLKSKPRYEEVFI